MASIEERKLKTGKMSYKAEIVLYVDGKRKKKSRSFSRRADAAAWAKSHEAALRDGRANFLDDRKAPTVADAVDMYLSTTNQGMGSTKRQVLNFFKDKKCEFSTLKIRDIESHHVKDCAFELVNAGRDPATANSYLLHVCHVLSIAEDDFGPSYRVDLDALTKGKASARRNGLAKKSAARDRRPTLEEIDKLLTYFEMREIIHKRAIPMTLIVPFAMFSLRRQAEIARLRWSDLEDSEMLVRKTKHPRKPEGEDRHTELTEEAKRVIQIHGKRNKDRIFPYNKDIISNVFTHAVRECEIEDLHFHDLRHEGISWLFEKGWSTRHVMMVSGHTSTQTLDRYTHLKKRGDKYKKWSWWERLENLHSKK